MHRPATRRRGSPVCRVKVGSARVRSKGTFLLAPPTLESPARVASHKSKAPADIVSHFGLWDRGLASDDSPPGLCREDDAIRVGRRNGSRRNDSGGRRAGREQCVRAFRRASLEHGALEDGEVVLFRPGHVSPLRATRRRHRKPGRPAGVACDPSPPAPHLLALLLCTSSHCLHNTWCASSYLLVSQRFRSHARSRVVPITPLSVPTSKQPSPQTSHFQKDRLTLARRHSPSLRWKGAFCNGLMSLAFFVKADHSMNSEPRKWAVNQEIDQCDKRFVAFSEAQLAP